MREAGVVKHPLHTHWACDDCHGDGVTLDEDYDDEGAIYRRSVRCEGCDGSGAMTSCDRCDQAMPLTEADLYGYLCAGCVLDIDRLDAAGERRELGRWMQ